MSFSSIDELRSQLGGPVSQQRTPEYIAKQMHAVPDAPVIDRNKFILGKVKGKHVLSFGASGPLHEQMVAAADTVAGVDRTDSDDIVGFDLDDVSQSDLPIQRLWEGPLWYEPDIIVCGEILEHLSNPGWFLKRLKLQWPFVPVIITVPNAMSTVGLDHMKRGTENVNIDHVSWYSWRTLSTLLSRVGYNIKEFYWYNGQPRFAEGLIVVTE